MVLQSSAKKSIGRMDSTGRNIYGTPRIRKPVAPIAAKVTPTSQNTLTFLSPQTSLLKKRKAVVRSQRVSDLINCISGLENLEMLAEPARRHLDSRFDFSPNMKERSSEMKSWLENDKPHRTENIISSQFSGRNRGVKRKSSEEDWKEDLVGDPWRSTLYFNRTLPKRRKVKKLVIHRPYTIEQLEKTYRMIDHWQEKMVQLQTQDWEYKRKHWVDQCHVALWNVLENPEMLEKPGSEMFPKILLPIAKLTCDDIHWRNVLVHSARVQHIACPEFAELTNDPRYETRAAVEEEFEFQIQFEFGFDLADIEWSVHAGVGSLGIDLYICHIISEFIGRSKFICDVQIYYKKSASPWWEQDGIAKMKYWSNGKYIDMIDFSAEDEVYFVRDWPKNNLVIDDYTGIHPSELEDEAPHLHMEKKFITSVCCQIIHICIWKTPAAQSCAARNVLKQISMIMKGWFIGVLLGESLDPDKVKFEYDTRVPCLAPVWKAF